MTLVSAFVSPYFHPCRASVLDNLCKQLCNLLWGDSPSFKKGTAVQTWLGFLLGELLPNNRNDVFPLGDLGNRQVRLMTLIPVPPI